MKRETVVSNAGPLIYLSLLNRFSLLENIFSTVFIPDAVYQEVVLDGRGQPGADEVRAAIASGWLVRSTVTERIAVDALLEELHAGEAEAIVLSRELAIERVLLDDRAARSKAQLMGLTVTGTVGILLLAHRAAIIEDIRPDLDRLIESNFRISRRLYDQLCQ
jgi:predicted nucleic acid-binding protein